MGFASSAIKLIKYKLSLAVTLSAATGFILNNGHFESRLLLLIGGVFCLAGGSAAFNQVQESHRDELMARTRNRPIPSGQLSRSDGFTIAKGFCLAGLFLLSALGLAQALLGMLTLLLYNGLYTWLKPRTSFAVLPGGLVGAIPPIIGWTAAGGEILHPNIIFIATLMFLWQMPHFWLLTIRYGEEYEAAGFKTLKKTLDDNQIKRLIIWWMVISLIFLLTAPLFGIHLAVWLLIAIAVLNILLIVVFYLILFRSTSDKMLRLVFVSTNIFLTFILMAFLLNALRLL